MKQILKLQLKYWQLVAVFFCLKLFIHLLTNTNYELHRDAYLYYAQSEHLAWGFHAVPPFVSIVGRISTLLFGNTTFGLRLFPAIIGAANIIVIGAFVKELKGNKLAFILAALAFIISPMFLHVNTLFQPVAINQFLWLLISFLFFRLINRADTRYWLWLGLIVGIAFLNKYSVVFLVVSFGVSLIISSQRTLIFSRHFLYGLAIGFLIISPNLVWQFRNGFPVIIHMQELKETQLVYVNLSRFFTDQILMHLQALPLILLAIVIVFLRPDEKKYRVFVYTLIGVILLIALGSGKSYYTMGVYPMLYIYGAIYLIKYIPSKAMKPLYIFLVLHIVTTLIVSFRFNGIPFQTAEQIYREDAFTWEDGKKYAIPQDLADMTGWEEIAHAVIEVYNDLDDKDCAIFCHHYGQAGSVLFHGKEHGLPEPACFNGSFAFWSPETITNKYVIAVVHERESYAETEQDITRFFDSWELKYTVKNDFFRENGTRIYLAKGPQKGFTKYYEDLRSHVLGKYQD